MLVARVLYLFAPLLASLVLSAAVHRWDLFPSWKVPIDAGATFRGARLFGSSKTWRGVAIAVVGSIATTAVQRFALADWAAHAGVASLDYAHVSPVLFGGALGAAAMAGELPNSFVKRQLHVPPGGTAKTPALRALFWTWDQVDLLTLAWPAILPWVRPDAELVLASFAVGLVVHPLVAWIGWLLGARRSAR